ncbi:aspartyl-phosphate phosphatase Spo0E family protein [Bacillus paranthracis]|uniref:Aspartyl-phosphate phosphatase Spo0E family protein n=1 Tax=Bacillus paranthracis TaxID=2026186 RepID=A0AAJ1K6K6_9BACI|nr:aspartyl-phosphate phosphatase Spo0E family protein [Bacillus paranthracis]MDG0949905.1 aspartyl-phosphate phosphatase Spo0E family protein [Bacillus paranthracis]MDG0955672.1 aspartyl-phosphate phosphatase Spo0E family protein [Bacillus paranthracis]
MQDKFLIQQIEGKKQEILQLVKQHGFTYPIVIVHSHELDRLVCILIKQNRDQNY